jgi:hypothetical protein
MHIATNSGLDSPQDNGGSHSNERVEDGPNHPQNAHPVSSYADDAISPIFCPRRQHRGSTMKFLKAAALAAAMWLAPAAALAQTSPGWPYGYVPTSAEWNLWFSNKTDYTGAAAITAAGGTLTGKLNLAASTSGTAGINCGVGSAPASPVNGDLWCTSAGMFVQIAGSTVPLGTSGGTLPVTGGGTGQSSFTANLPILGNGTGALAQGTRSGNTTTFGTVTGTTTSGDCVAFDASGNLHDAGVGACGGTGGSGTVASASTGQLAIYTGATTVSGLAGCNNGYFGTTGSTVSCLLTFNTTLSATITALGTIASGTWQGTLVSPIFGGTGVNNGSFTSTLAGNFVTAGAAVTLTAIGATNVTLPTSGTLMNQNGTSGGIPYYNTSTSVQSTGALTANLPLFGGGAGAAPFSGTRLGNTTRAQMANGTTSAVTGDCVSYDANGNTQDSGQPCGSANAAPVLLATLTASASSILTDVGSACGASGCFTNVYPTYTIRIVNVIATSPSATTSCQIQVYSSSTYQNTGYISQFSITGTIGSNNPVAYIPCSANSGLGANGNGSPGVSGQFTVQNPSASIKSTWVASLGTVTGTTSSPSIVTGQVFGWWNTAAAVTGFRLYFGTSAGVPASSVASGTIEIYGNP